MVTQRVDPEEVATVVHGIVASLQGDLSAADIKLFQELEGLARYIENARHEITALRTDEIRTEHIPTATDELDAIVTATEKATGSILDSAEKIESIAASLEGSQAEELGMAVTSIYEACNFQDVTGQRISKVVKTLQHIESKVDALVETFGGDKSAAPAPRPGAAVSGEISDKDLLNGPQLPADANSQDDIDALFESLD